MTTPPQPPRPQLSRLAPHQLQVIQSIRLVGVTLDSKFNWSNHVTNIVRRDSYKLYMVRHMKALGIWHTPQDDVPISCLVYFYRHHLTSAAGKFAEMSQQRNRRRILYYLPASSGPDAFDPLGRLLKQHPRLIQHLFAPQSTTSSPTTRLTPSSSPCP